MLDAIGAGLAPRIGDRDWADIWIQSPEYNSMRLEIEHIKREALARPEGEKRKEAACKCYSLCIALDSNSSPSRRDSILVSIERSRQA